MFLSFFKLCSNDWHGVCLWFCEQATPFSGPLVFFEFEDVLLLFQSPFVVVVVVIGLFRLLTYSWLNFDGLIESRKLYISIRFSSLIEKRFLKYFLIIFQIVLVSFVTFSCSIFIVYLGLLYFYYFILFLVSWIRCLSILLIFSKNQLLDSLILYIVSFVFIALISAQYSF